MRKGVVWDRGENPLTGELVAWLEEQEESRGWQMEVVTVGGGGGEDSGYEGVGCGAASCNDSDCDDEHKDHNRSNGSDIGERDRYDSDEHEDGTDDEHKDHNRSNDSDSDERDRYDSDEHEDGTDGTDGTDVQAKIKAASARLVSNLPLSLQAAVQQDAEALAAVMLNSCPGLRSKHHLTLQIELIGKNGCSRWHQDSYVGRVLTTYVMKNNTIGTVYFLSRPSVAIPHQHSLSDFGSCQLLRQLLRQLFPLFMLTCPLCFTTPPLSIRLVGPGTWIADDASVRKSSTTPTNSTQMYSKKLMYHAAVTSRQLQFYVDVRVCG